MVVADERPAPYPDLSDPKADGRGKFLLGLFERELNSKKRRADWDSRWAKALKPHLDGPARPDVALALALTLGSAAVPNLLKVLEASVKKGECGVVEALGKLRAPEAIGPLIPLMPTQQPHHYCIHDALKLIGDPAAIPPLKELLADTKQPARKMRLQVLIAELEKREAKSK